MNAPDGVPQDEFDRVVGWLESVPFQFAKTMPQTPHFYTLRKKWANEANFVETVLFIRKYGYKGTYGKTTYTYFNIGPYKYWTMGDAIGNTILINRAELDHA
jgi:hypothetical protein